ncbi:cell division protein FtsL [Phyllobacterium sp. P5_D12]
MLRTFDIILIGLMILAAAVTYKIKHDAENQMTQVTRLQRMITDERDTIDLLKADWSLLTQPNRLQKLVETFQGQLDLQQVEAQQIININELPQPKPVSQDLDDVANIITEADAGEKIKPDTTMTGSINKPKAAPKPPKRIVPIAAPKAAGLY